MEINTHGMVCDFGKHKGELYTRLPVNYLIWMVNSNHSRINIAEAELKRRGTVVPNLSISGHAIDRASLNCRKVWHETKNENEGLHAWLIRISHEALTDKIIDKSGKYKWNNLKLVFEFEGKWPVLKTVIRKK